jgi:hypothetical protein
MFFNILLPHPMKQHNYLILALIIIFHLLFFSISTYFFTKSILFFGIPAGVQLGIPPSQTLTFIFVPKPYPSPYEIAMAKIILQVCLSYPFTQILMFRNQTEYDPSNEIVPFIHQMFSPDRLQFAAALPTGYKNRPLLRNWFIEGCRLVKHGYLCFLNGDMIIPPFWMNAAMAIFEVFHETNLSKTLIYGIRTDVYRRDGIFELSRKKSTFVYDLVAWITKNIRGDGPYGMDVVLIHSSFDALNWTQLPDFVLGMPIWDNYFMGWANQRVNTVSMNFGAKIYYIDHSHTHLNDENFEYFRTMSAESPHFAGFQEHHQATWIVEISSRKLIKGWYESLKFKRLIDDVIRSEFD